MNSFFGKHFLLTICFLFEILVSAKAQVEPGSHAIHWMSFSDAVKENQKQPKKIFIDVYTKWCGWCKRMDATTYEDSAVINFMNANYYAVHLDAETKDTIIFRDKQFVFRPEYKANELALSLMSGKMSYPTVIYLDENFGLLAPSPGYQSTEQLMPQLKYFANDIYKEKTWEEYQKDILSH